MALLSFRAASWRFASSSKWIFSTLEVRSRPAVVGLEALLVVLLVRQEDLVQRVLHLALLALGKATRHVRHVDLDGCLVGTDERPGEVDALDVRSPRGIATLAG